MLMTQRQMLHAQNLRFPNPERLPKVDVGFAPFRFRMYTSFLKSVLSCHDWHQGALNQIKVGNKFFVLLHPNR